MTIQLPTPGTAKIRRRPRYIPEPRPEGGYIVTNSDEPSFSVHGDQGPTISQMIVDLESLDTAMLIIERKIDTMMRKLSDPAMLDRWPADDPIRIEAEDRLAALFQSLNAYRIEVSRIASEIHSRGTYLFAAGNESALDRYGSALVRDCGALGRVQSDVAGLLTGMTWARLYDAACPF